MHYLRNHRYSLSHVWFCSALISMEDSRSTALKHLPGVYQRHLPPGQHTVGKLTMQKIERKHLTLRTRLKRLARKTLCFSRSRVMHDLYIGLYMNQVEFGCAA